MLAVLVVNTAGYLAAPWGASLGERAPPDSDVAAGVQGVIAASLQGKGYPVLAFVFGMGLWYATRGLGPVDARERGRVRQRSLLGLGLVHGLFVYFGDILTLYALVGWSLLQPVREPWRALRSRLRRALGWALAALVVPLTVVVVLGMHVGEPHGLDPTLAQARGWLDFWQINASGYLALQLTGLLLAWPVVRLCMLCGVAAARLRLLTHRRWRTPLARWTGRLAGPVVLLNLAYGVACVLAPATRDIPLVTAAFGSLVSLPLAAVYVAALALASRGGRARWCAWLVPLGTRTLTLYIGHGVLCMLLFSGAGLAWRPGTAGMAAGALLLWCLALLAAHLSGRLRWPLEAWLARRRNSGWAGR